MLTFGAFCHTLAIGEEKAYNNMAAAPEILSSLFVNVSNSIGWRHEAEPERLFIDIASFDAAPGGFPRGRITEIVGSTSSGRTTVVHRLIACATRRAEYCALVDATNSFDPRTAAESGADLDAVVWVRCSGNLVHAMKATDLLAHSGGFGVIALDLCDVQERELRRIPLSWWYRLRRAVEGTKTVLVLLEREPLVKACASLVVAMNRRETAFQGRDLFKTLPAGEFHFASLKPMQAGLAESFHAAACNPDLRAEY
jgi:hypothetical protein